MRKLASIQTVVDVQPIPGADKIECLTVLGWKCIARKGEFNKSDLVVYIEPDSLLSFNPWTGAQLGDKPLRIKTVRMKKQLSQGLVLAVATYNQLTGLELTNGQDVSELIGVTKYEPPVPGAVLAGLAKGDFPFFLPKTDETRIQAAPSVLHRHESTPFAVTEKLDGMSTTYYWHDEDASSKGRLPQGARHPYIFGACSRNLEFKPDESTRWTLAKTLSIPEALLATQEEWGHGVSLQGELVGPNIQGNKLNLSRVTFYAFNLYDIVTRAYVPHDEFIQWCTEHKIPHVPVLDNSFSLKGQTVDSLLEYATRRSTLNPAVWAEGCVFRPLAEQHDAELEGRLSFKAINPEFLLRHDE